MNPGGLLTVVACVALMFAPVSGIFAHAADSQFAGLDSRGIVERIRSDCRPTKIVANSNDIDRIIASYACLPHGGCLDYFSDAVAMSLSDLRRLEVVSLSWWDAASGISSVEADLHNIVPANAGVASNRRDYPPGVVTEPLYTNGFWCSGIGAIEGMETNFYEPADRFKGDFARIYMYMAAVYPQPLWSGRAPMIYADGYYPLLTAYGRDILLKWHREDPVSDLERKRDSAIALEQGCGNPFVSCPKLAEYIWGVHCDEIFPGGDDPDGPSDPDDPSEEPIMLKARYSVSADRRIDLRSPYVAAGSSWTIDGSAVSGESISLDEVTVGRHELRYAGDRSRGKLIITVEP